MAKQTFLPIGILIAMGFALLLVCLIAFISIGGVTTRLPQATDTWITFDDRECGYLIRYPPQWFVHDIGDGFPSKETDFQYCAIIADMPGNLTWNDTAPNTNARLIIARQPRRPEETLEQWVAFNFSDIAQVPERVQFQGKTVLRFVESESQMSGLFVVRYFWIESSEHFFSLAGYVRRDGKLDTMTELIDTIQLSFTPF